MAARIERLRTLFDNPDIPEKMRGPIRDIVDSLMGLSMTQHELNKRLWDRYNSLPQPHAFTHMGGDDSVEGTELPSAITIGAEGDIGTPSDGYAPIDHIHDTTDLDLLGGIEVDNLGQASVMDVRLLRALEELLLAVKDLRDQLLLAIEPKDVTATYYYPTSQVFNDGTPSGSFPFDLTEFDDNEYDVQEENLTPGQDFYFDFTGVSAFNAVIFIGRYDGASPHIVQVRIYDWVSSAWRTLGILLPNTIDVNMTRHVPNEERFMKDGHVRIGFYHAAAGNSSHHTYLNYLSVANLVGNV